MTAALNLSWPDERRVETAPTPTEAYFARRREEALDALAHPRFDRAEIAAVAAWLRIVRNAGGRLPDRAGLGDALVHALDSARLDAEATRLREDLDRDGEGHDLAPAAAALAACGVLHLLRQDTDARSWRLLTALRRYDNRLRPAVNAVLAAALSDEQDLKDRFIALAEDTVDAAVEAPERQVMAHEQEMFARLLKEWRDGPDLQDLWVGLRGLGYVHPLGEATEVLREVARFDPPRFVKLLERFDNPYPVWSAIEGTQALRHLEAWRGLVEAAPRAFAADGSWTGSVILPLLLCAAAQAVARGGAPHRRYETAAEAEADGAEVRRAAEQAADVLLSREDGAQAALRWAARLARELTIASAEGPPIPGDARDRAFAPWQLLAALAQRARFDAWRPLDPADMSAEEAWFNLMAKAVAVSMSPTSAGDYADLFATFADAWPDRDEPETWQGDPGARLRALSAVVRLPGRQPSTLGVRLLAMPLTMAPDPVSAWIDLWRRCAVLREAVEFAERRLNASSADDRPWAPGELCWLIVNLGVCAVDQIVDERIDLPYDRGAALAALMPELWDGVAEMLAIDRFGRETWDRARRHLVLRRMLFAVDRTPGSGPRAIPADARPSLATMLGEMATIERPFFSILVDLLDVGIEPATLRSALGEAAIDLPTALDAAERVNAVDDRRSIINAREVERLRRL